ncbi:Bug family tripartite tricarboxylate transporter substrate binding protein [Xenophilus aerolatus]|nr:tripartite tricarboxylate transporter substrate binding protein [Xenophilus aerolatus]
MNASLNRRAATQLLIAGAFAPLEVMAQLPAGRPIRILVGVAPGNATDAAARQLALRLAPLLKQTLFVENKPGGHGAIVADAVRSAPKDGTTLLFSSGGQLAINPSLYPHLNYDPQRDFEPVSMVGRGYLYLAVRPESPFHSVKDLIDHVKAHAGRVSYGSGGNGTTQHLAMELLKKKNGLDMAHIPYRGSPMALQDLIGGQILCLFDAGASILPQARQGRVRLLGVTAAQRDPLAPETPTLREQGFDIGEVMVWSGLLAPSGTPKPVIDQLSEAVRAAVRQPDYIEYARATGGSLAGSTSEEFKSLLAEEIATWGPLVKQSGARVE